MWRERSKERTWICCCAGIAAISKKMIKKNIMNTVEEQKRAKELERRR
jgi:hypothetical protein